MRIVQARVIVDCHGFEVAVSGCRRGAIFVDKAKVASIIA